MADILTLISDADRLAFSQNLSIARPNFLGDELFPDQKTRNLKAEYLRLASNARIPVMATVHGFDTEAEIASRPVFDKVSVEKMLIKRKINQTEKQRQLTENGVWSDDEIVKYTFDDMRMMADSVKTRTEVAKMEVLSTGKMAIKENNVDLSVNYGVPDENTAYTLDLSESADIIGQIQAIVDDARDNGYLITRAITSNVVMRKLSANTGIQTRIYGTVGAGTYAPTSRIEALFGEIFGFSTITSYDLRYKYETASGSTATKRFFPEDKITFIATGITNTFGFGLWGVTPEEEKYGQYTEKSQNQFITITQWNEPDPVAVWTKASGLFIPVLPDPEAIYIATDTTEVSG